MSLPCTTSKPGVRIAPGLSQSQLSKSGSWLVGEVGLEPTKA